MLELIALTKEYDNAGGRTLALDSVTLAFGGRGLVCILGESGCGKTTLLNMAGGLDTPTHGEVRFRGKRLSDMTEREINEYRGRNVGFVFQHGELLGGMNAEENVALPCRIAGMKDALSRARAALAAVGIDKPKARVDELSGGQAQRVAIARAIAADPSVILADEPTGALDAHNGEEVVSLLKKLSRDRSVIMVTHNRALAEKYADRLITLKGGRIVGDTAQSDVGDANKNGSAELCGESGAKSVGSADGESAMPRESGAREKTGDGTSAKPRAVRSRSCGAAFPVKTGLGNLTRSVRRSLLLSFICAVGTLCIAAVLAFTGGAFGFVDDFYKTSLSSYPVSAGEGTYDIAALTENRTLDPSRLKDDVYVRTYFSDMYFRLTDGTPIGEEYLEYVSRMDKSLTTYVFYDYLIDYPSYVFTETNINGTRLNVSLSYIYDYAGRYSSSEGLDGVLPSVFSPLPDNRDYVLSSLDLVYGEYPDSPDETALVIDEDGAIDEYVLAFLGYYSTEEIENYFSDGSEQNKYDWSFEELTSKKFTLFYNDVVYTPSGKAFAKNDSFSRSVRPLGITDPSDGRELNISCVLRRRSGDAIDCGLYYSTALTSEFIADALNSDVVAYMNEEYDYRGVYPDPLTGDALPEKSGRNEMASLGGLTLPSGIRFYASSAEAREKITEYLAAWNEANYDKRVVYADNVSSIVSYASSVLTKTSAVLFVIAAVVAVASALMLAAMTAFSSRMRRREFAVMRCMGMPRAFVSVMMMTESAFVGLVGGVAGVAIVYIALAVMGALTSFALSPLFLSPWAAVCVAVGCAAVAALACLPPALAASSMPPVAAMRGQE